MIHLHDDDDYNSRTNVEESFNISRPFHGGSPEFLSGSIDKKRDELPPKWIEFMEALGGKYEWTINWRLEKQVIRR